MGSKFNMHRYAIFHLDRYQYTDKKKADPVKLLPKHKFKITETYSEDFEQKLFVVNEFKLSSYVISHLV